MSYPIASRDSAMKQKRHNGAGDVYSPPIEQGPQVYLNGNLPSNGHYGTYLPCSGYYTTPDISTNLDAVTPCLPLSDSYPGHPALYTIDMDSMLHSVPPELAFDPVHAADTLAPFSPRFIHPGSTTSIHGSNPPPSEHFSNFNHPQLNDMIDAFFLASGQSSSSSSSSSTTDGTPPIGADSPSDTPREGPSDPRVNYLTEEQRPWYNELIRMPGSAPTIDALLSIAVRGNLKPTKQEIAAFLTISQHPGSKTGKGSRVGLKKYRCFLCAAPEMDRWDTAEYHIHSHLGLKVYPCEFPQCGYRFRRPHELKNHEETIHKLFKQSAQHGGRRVPGDSFDVNAGIVFPAYPNRTGSTSRPTFAVAQQQANASPTYSTGSFAIGSDTYRQHTS